MIQTKVVCGHLDITVIRPERRLHSLAVRQDGNIEPRKLPRKYHSECWRYNLAIVLLEMIVEAPYSDSEER